MDYATAAAAVDPANGFVANCIAAGGGGSSGSTTYTAAFDGTTMTVSGTFPSPAVTFDSGSFSISAGAGATLTFSKTAGVQIRASIYDCTGTLVESVSPGSGPITSSPLPRDDVYYVQAIAFNPPGPGSPFSACDISMTSSDAYWVNPVIALWDDSGTTRQLEACPRTLAPIGTEQSGDWFADATEAAGFFSSTGSEQVADCLGIIDWSWSGGSLSAKAATGGATPSVSAEIATASIADSANIQLRRGVSLMGGDTITANIVLLGSSGGAGIDVRSIFDVIDPITGTVEFTDTQSSGGDSLSISPTFTAPWTGKFYLNLRARYRASGPAAGDFQASIGVSSSGTMNGDAPVQALYDVGLTCPARLDCS